MNKRKQNKFLLIITTTILTVALSVFTPISAMAGQPNTGINGGQFTDWNTLTWTANDGTDITYGRGPVFSDLHPEITDQEYYLKEAVLYPGETAGSLNRQGKPKSNFSSEGVEEVRKFLNSFDWLHSDELTRTTMIHDRISNGYHGNVYAYPEPINGFPLLLKGKGQCDDFAGEFCRLAQFVGLECETYTPSYLHRACLIKINGQWFATDPTSTLPFLSNAKTYPVDYEAEKNRYTKESDAEWEEYKKQNPDSWAVKINEMDRQLAAGEITDQQYDEMYTALLQEGKKDERSK